LKPNKTYTTRDMVNLIEILSYKTHIQRSCALRNFCIKMLCLQLALKYLTEWHQRDFSIEAGVTYKTEHDLQIRS